MWKIYPLLFLFLTFVSCIKDPEPSDVIDLTNIPYNPESYDLEIPEHLPGFINPEDNPLTNDGIVLGQHLFFDPILSIDSTKSCSSCHVPEKAFTDDLPVSVGVNGLMGTRSSMSLVNIAFAYNGLFWDGNTQTLEDQAILPVIDPVELLEDWDHVEIKMRRNERYRELFRKAFGISKSTEMTRELATKALAQYQRIIISADSKFDRVEYGNNATYTLEELEGRDMYFDSDPLLPDAECGHCHNGALLTTQEYFNNGIEEVESLDDFPDEGRGKVTNILFDNGKFRAPTLRNIGLTAPYMHDGRFETLEEVLDHYNSGGHFADNIDPLIRPLNLTEKQKENIILFLHTLTDTSYLENPLIRNPYK